MSELFTIGYEGADVNSIIHTLARHQIQLLADVRELPLSRKKGLSKSSFAAALANRGIDYVHFKALGDPKPGRQAARSGDYTKFEEIFLSHLSTPDAQDALHKLLEVAQSKRTCILCFERCASVCHRSYIADEAAHCGFDVYDLMPAAPKKLLTDGPEISRYNPRQSLAAAE